jgi:hypothetical protein
VIVPIYMTTDILMAIILMSRNSPRWDDPALADIEKAVRWLRSHGYTREAARLDLHLVRHHLLTKKPGKREGVKNG